MTKYFQHLIQQTGFQIGASSGVGIQPGHSPSNQSAPLVQVEDRTRFVPQQISAEFTVNLNREPAEKIAERKLPSDLGGLVGDVFSTSEVQDRGPVIETSPSLEREKEDNSIGHSLPPREEIQRESSREFDVVINQLEVEESGEESSPFQAGEIRKKNRKVEVVDETRASRGGLAEVFLESNSVDEHTSVEIRGASQERKGIRQESLDLQTPQSVERTWHATLDKVREWVSETPPTGESQAFGGPNEVEVPVDESTVSDEPVFTPAVPQYARPERKKTGSANPEIQDFQFSIGSINVTIEETPVLPPESPGPREAPTQPAAFPNNSPRLRRHYLKVR